MKTILEEIGEKKYEKAVIYKRKWGFSAKKFLKMQITEILFFTQHRFRG